MTITGTIIRATHGRDKYDLPSIEIQLPSGFDLGNDPAEWLFRRVTVIVNPPPETKKQP